eukprot:TRINITY_DN313_c0_g2_i6.p1 TRINITY_DN313_c0_g2~~TRINITY_DN313_c0_g2_i6.p1  ORF type:complete len:161 (-),score=31.05 TRINITY_DN313_c0_g2_i6:166-648(-)
MQNVMLQMNLNLVSVDGIAIKSAQKWIKRCLSCRKFVKEMEDLFCKNCGSNCLQKISYTVSKDGSINYNLPRFKPSLRGTIYPIPYPKGGRNNKDLIISAQQLPKQRKQKKDIDLDDPDLLFFQTSGRNLARPPVVGYGKRNPNQAKRKIGKKNKSNGQQ